MTAKTLLMMVTKLVIYVTNQESKYSVYVSIRYGEGVVKRVI